jgi:hypothetical protein
MPGVGMFTEVTVPLDSRTKFVRFPALSMLNPTAAPLLAMPFAFVPAAAAFPELGKSKLVKT